MKLTICLVSLVFCLNAFAAGLDDFIGKYRAKDGDGIAEITKTLVKERTLFEPEEYVYHLEVQREKDEIYRAVDLEVSKDKKSLYGSNSDDCDNPDCHAFNSFEALVEKKSGKIQLKISYEGYNTTDEDHDYYEEFSGEAVFLKVR